jgi:hypothetical protein
MGNVIGLLLRYSPLFSLDVNVKDNRKNPPDKPVVECQLRYLTRGCRFWRHVKARDNRRDGNK